MIILNLFCALLLVVIGWAAFALGIFPNALFVFILLMVPMQVGAILWRVWRGTLEARLWRTPLLGELRWHRLQVFNGWIFWLLVVGVLKMCVVPAQFTAQEYTSLQWMMGGGIAALMLLELLPRKRLFVATNAAFALGSVFMTFQLGCIVWPVSSRDGVVLSPPFHGEWLVVQGGRSSLVNHHYPLQSQRDALDLAQLANGHDRIGDRAKLESYPAWGAPLLAPADGRVAVVVNDCRDNAVGQTDEQHLAGNHISIDLGNGRFVILCHLQKGSAQVAVGDIVHTGQFIARCGNSGNTSQPHLHLQVQNKPEILTPGAETRLIFFRDANWMRGGHFMKEVPFFARRNDRIISPAVVGGESIPEKPEPLANTP